MLLITNEQGQGLIEYALILVLVSMLGMGFLGMFGQQLEVTFNEIRTTLMLVGT